MYTGHENLLVMQHARNYNAFLGRLIRQYGKGRIPLSTLVRAWALWPGTSGFGRADWFAWSRTLCRWTC